jgi:hypothetical protein
MKTNERARKVSKLRHYGNMLVVLLLLSAEFWMFWCLGHSCRQATEQPGVPLPAMGDWFAAK